MPARAALCLPAGHIWKNWKERHFVLDKHLLKYYAQAKVPMAVSEDAASGELRLGDLKGVIQVQNCTVTTASPTEADGRQFCFKITPVSRKIYLINASDEATRDAWIAAVRNNSTCAYDAASHSGADGSSSGDTKMEEEPNSEDVRAHHTEWRHTSGAARAQAADAPGSHRHKLTRHMRTHAHLLPASPCALISNRLVSTTPSAAQRDGPTASVLLLRLRLTA